MAQLREEESVATGPAEHRVTVPGSFEQFYSAHYRRVVALLTALTSSRWVAEDLAQEAFLRAHRDWHRVEQADSPEAWVRRVAINLSHSRFRRMRAEAAALVKGGSTPRRADMDTSDESFWSEVVALPRRQAEAIALRYVDDLTTAEIAAAMGTAEGTTRALLSQGRARLERQLRSKGLI